MFYGDCEFKTNFTLPFNTFLVKSTQTINVINEILERNEPRTYYDENEIVLLLNATVLNGESEEIKAKHKQNIKRIFG